MTTDVPISDEMVEAGAKALAARDGYDWCDMPPYREGYTRIAETVLQAALAHYQDPRVKECDGEVLAYKYADEMLTARLTTKEAKADE